MLANKLASLIRADSNGGVTDWSSNTSVVGGNPYRIQNNPFMYLAGVTLTFQEAISLSAVWACGDVITKAIACSSWDSITIGLNRQRTLNLNDPLDWVLNTRANRDMTAIAWKEAMFFSAIFCGGGFSEIVMDGANRVSELWPLPYDDVTPHPNAQGYMEYRFKPYGATEYRIIPANRMFHLRGPSLFGWLGENMVVRAAKTLGLALAAERFSSSFFENGTEIGGTLEYPGKLDDKEYKAIVESWRARYQGPHKAHMPAILEKGMTFNPLAPDASKAQLIEEKKFLVEEVARWFGVPPHKIQHLDRATFNNIEHLGIEFVRDCLTPWAVRAEEEARFKLFSVRSPKQIDIDTKWLEFGDAASRVAYHQGMRRMGAENSNEIRASEGLNSIGPQGDVYAIESNMQRLDLIGTVTPPGGATPPTSDKVAKDAVTQLVSSSLERHKKRLDNRATDLRKDTTRAETVIVAALEPERVRGRVRCGEECQGAIDLIVRLGGPCVQSSERILQAARAVESGCEPLSMAKWVVNELMGA